MVEDCIVETIDGPLRGRVADDGVLAFLGVPYARAPVGSIRFEPPHPPKSWLIPRDATLYGPTAPQPPARGSVPPLLPRREIPGFDYLNLNIWTSALRGSRPVMVFLHGGAFVRGSGAIPTYDGTNFARAGVVLVTINYRLGADGFLWFGPGSANLGLLDQIAALEWVRDNAEAFGGDPANVTIFGESSGAMSVCTLLAVPAATGLFRRAVAQSGAASCVVTPATAAQVGCRLAELLGVEPSREAIALVTQRDLLDAEMRLALEISTEPDPDRWGELARKLMPFEPVVDGTTLPSAPLDALAAGAGAEVDLLIGTNADEGNFFFPPADGVEPLDEKGLSRIVRSRQYPPGALEACRRTRPRATPAEVAAHLMTDGFYLAPALKAASLHANARVYRFDWRSPALEGRLGACHALELPFVFNNLEDAGYATLLGHSPPRQLAASMNYAWVDFATNGHRDGPSDEDGQPVIRHFGGVDGAVAPRQSPELELWNDWL